MERRDFLRLMALQAAAWSLGCGRHEPAGRLARGKAADSAAAAWARRGLPPNEHSGRWMGDDFGAGHRLRDGQQPPLGGGTRQPPADVVVVGAGISGLVAARALAKQGLRVRLLEQAPVAGGNSQSAEWGGIEYSIGAAYLTRPEPDTEIDTLYREIGVMERAVKVPKGESLFGGRLLEDFWSGETDPAHAEGTKRVREAWRTIYDDRYPEIPWTRDTQGWTRAQFVAADREPFSALLERIGAPPHVLMFCEYYCWSSFGGSASEISSYAALNFVTAEFGDILALPGGNAGVEHALVADLERRGASIATGRFVASVRTEGDGVEVVAVAGGAVERHVARAAIVAVPRFVARRIVNDFPDERTEIASKLRWRAYVVANVLLARRPTPSWYDAYRLEPLDPHASGWTDLILADFVASPKQDRSVLTAYRALPYDAGRTELLTDADYPRHRDAIRRDLRPWLAALGLRDDDIVDINLARWGHPLVLAQTGQLSSGVLETLSAPLGRVAFAQQDRYGVPAIENAIAAGFESASEVGAMLRRPAIRRS